MAGHPILFSFRRCPYAIRARMALKYAAVQCELREVVLRNKPRQMLAISSKGTVPVLQLSDGRVIDESLDVMYWALSHQDVDGWLDVDAEQCRILIEKNDNEFKLELDRYKYFQNYPERTQQEYRICCEVFLTELEQALSASNAKGLLGNKRTVADFAIFPFVRQFARVDWDWFIHSRYESLKCWFNEIEQGELFISVMEKYPLWEEGQALTLFG